MSDEIYFDPSLFINESYEEAHYTIDDKQYTVYASTAASTDHDLTGQIVWPVSVYLSWFIAKNPAIFHDKTVLELGAGCGLPGIVASSFAKHVYLTDGNEVVLRMLERTKQELSSNPTTLSIRDLLWGDKPALDTFLHSIQVLPNVIIGADVICWPHLIQPLLHTIKYLFQHLNQADSSFYCGFVCRATSTRDLLYNVADDLDINITEINPAAFLPDPLPMDVQSENTLQLLHFQFHNLRRPVQFDETILQRQGAC